MKKALCTLCAVLLLLILPAQAMQSTTYTYTLNIDGDAYVRMQDAYMPGGAMLADIGLNAPEDLYWHDGCLYIADTGTGRIVRVNLADGSILSLGGGTLSRPTGVAVAADGRIFVADYGADAVVVLSPEGDVLQTLTRPETVLYGRSPYKPRRVDVDSFGNIYVISEGTHEGLLQFSPGGSFEGFFGANKTKGLSPVEWFQKTFYTDEQKDKMLFRTPPNIVSLDVSSRNLIHTVTQNDPADAVKKLNLAGVNILPTAGSFRGENSYVDVAVQDNGFFYAITSTGSIEEFDPDGELLLMFGGRAGASDRNGLTAVVSALEVGPDGTLYVLDKERTLVQTYQPTEFARLMHKAGEDFQAGQYAESLNSWETILRMNPMTRIAHYGLAQSQFQLGQYEEAAAHFRLIGQQAQYSDCFWELRTLWLRQSMGWILAGALLLAAVWFVLWLLGRKKNLFATPRSALQAFKSKHRLLRDVSVTPFALIRHPIDTLYDIKHGLQGSLAGASILYGAAFLMYFLVMLLTSFVFGGGISSWQNPWMLAVAVILPAGVFVVGSYLISSINDGEGTLRQVYICFGYALSPYIVFSGIPIVLSHLFTTTESFVYELMITLILGYTALLVLLAIRECHDYSLKKTLSNVVLTLFFMILLVLALLILFILWRQVLAFFETLLEEVRYLAFRS